jgi:hypothetical protein
MSTVDVATLKARTEEFVAKAIAGEATLIEQNGKRARRRTRARRIAS